VREVLVGRIVMPWRVIVLMSRDGLSVLVTSSPLDGIGRGAR
jgi:hypothetical protein